MDFHNLAYWQEKANNIAIETRLFINGEYSAAADNSDAVSPLSAGKRPTSSARSRPPAASSIAATGRRPPLPSAKRCCINSPT